MRRAEPWRKGSTPSTAAVPNVRTEAADRAKLTTMREVTRLYLAKNEAKWSNAKHRREWQASLDKYVLPVMGNVPADAVEVAHVLKCIEPHWQRIPETARRILGRIEELLTFAHVAGLRSSDANPAKWQGGLDAVLPAPSRVRAKVHHPALHYRDIPAFMTRLRAERGVPARALELIALTAVRLNEAVGTRWQEIDTAAKTWTIPASRMKRRQPHLVPLSTRA